MSSETDYGAELRAANEEIYKRALELARLKQELEISKEQELKKAQEVGRLKDEFVFLAVHELKTPIAAIQGFLELTQGSLKEFPIDVQRNLEAISDASGLMSQVINDLLEIARSESGTMKVEVTPQDFAPIVDEVVQDVKPLIDRKKIKVDISINPIPSVLCDRMKLKEVLTNLVSNAIKYNKEGGAIYISAFRPAGEVRMVCEVRDTGYGIAKEKQDKIFEKFYRAIGHETQEVLGTGLGLFITRMLIERMGGTLVFSSLEHEGSTFAFTLPLAEVKK